MTALAEDLDILIDNLAIWSTGDYGGDSLREKAIAALEERRPEAVPALVQRLEDLLDASARHRERLTGLLRAWDAWYSEGRMLHAEHGGRADIEPYRTVRTETLPPASIRDEYRAPVQLKQGVVEALHRLGDPRAAPVLVSALADRDCVQKAARALRDVRTGEAVPALLDAAARVQPHDRVFDDILGTLRDYGLTPDQARERFEAATSPKGRVALWHLLFKLDEAGDQTPPKSAIRDSLIFLAADVRDRRGSREAVDAIYAMDSRPAPRLQDTDMGALPPADIVHSAIALAARGLPPGHDDELLGSLRHVRHLPEVMQVAQAIITERTAEPDVPLLHLALEFILGAPPWKLEDRMELVRTLHGLISHADSRISARARAALLRDDLLFTQMHDDDAAVRQEATAIFEELATPEDRTNYAGYARVHRPPLWRRLLRR